MRMCERNLKTFHYATYKGKAEHKDSFGNATGLYKVNYGNPIEARGRISASRGSADVELFGINLMYHRTITVTDMECPIDENSVIWIDQDVTKPNNYVVVSVARDINYIVYAIKKVSAS